MPRPRTTVPTYSHHKPTDQAYIRVSDGNGGRRLIYLGKYNSPESQAEYARIIAELAASPGRAMLPARNGPDVSVNEVLLAFTKHAEQHYRRPDGTTTHELTEYKLVIKVVRELYGHTAAASFGPLALKAVRQKMIDSGLCRKVLNRRIGRAKRVFKWAVAEELVPTSVHQALAAVTGL